MIQSIEQAFSELEMAKVEIPFEPIRYLYNQSRNKEICDKIQNNLIHAYDHIKNNGSDIDDINYTPLWYAIVAENHLCKELVDPVIKLFTATAKDWEMLNEQGGYLVGALCETFPDYAPRKFMDAIYEQIETKSNSTYIFLFDAIHYINKETEKDKLLEIAGNTDFLFYDSFVGYLADINLQEALPILKNALITESLHKFVKIEIKEAINRLENKKSEIGKLNQPFVKWRGNWEEHYKSFEEIFV